jgi:glucuronate isomerase
MTTTLELHPDRLFPIDKDCREITRRLYDAVKALPIISPHGHTDPSWFANNELFANPHSLFIAPDHYLLRMLYSQGITMAELGIPSEEGEVVADARSAWRTFAEHYYLFSATPTGFWLNHIFSELFNLRVELDENTADHYFDTIADALRQESFRPRALLEKFNIEIIATTDSAIDSLEHHKAISNDSCCAKVIPTYRPDSVIDPEHHAFYQSLSKFGEITGEDVQTWDGYLNAHRKRRAEFIALGATATDHGHPTANTADLSKEECSLLFERVINRQHTKQDAELFRAQMLTEMAGMSISDGLVMQVHPGSFRNHNKQLLAQYGADKGADIPVNIEYTEALRPLLNRFGNNTGLSLILFTMDESTYARELAPLAGHYPCLKLGPAWWFHDSPHGMVRFREQTTETAGFYNTVGFNDDTRALLSIPARHDMARRIDCSYLARLVAEHRLTESQASKIAIDLAYYLPKQAYRIDKTS